eukprot:GHVU01162606.1.p1 GENE.GHVU01162606.1~~GHVU01162606.1.p1  ORF type:complete len:157 (+),score=12.01 GHVU01162606.1:379-849(+)
MYVCGRVCVCMCMCASECRVGDDIAVGCVRTLPMCADGCVLGGQSSVDSLTPHQGCGDPSRPRTTAARQHGTARRGVCMYAYIHRYMRKKRQQARSRAGSQSCIQSGRQSGRQTDRQTGSGICSAGGGGAGGGGKATWRFLYEPSASQRHCWPRMM